MKKRTHSAVITTYNSINKISECLKSIYYQSVPFDEVIIVDNYSTDHTIEFIRSKYPQTKLIVMPSSNYGACETLNIGFSTVKSEYIAVLDDDVIIEKDWLKKITRQIDKTTAIVTSEVYSKNNIKYNDGHIKSFHGCGSLFQKKILKDVGYYDTRFFIYVNEEDLSCKIYNKKYKIKKSDAKTIHDRPYEIRSNKRSIYYHTRNRYWVMWKHYPLSKIPKYTILFFIYNLIETIKCRAYVAFITAHIHAILGMPYCLKNRKRVNSDVFYPLKITEYISKAIASLK